MSLFGSLSSAVSGIRAQGAAIGIISDNISNVNTVGYKAGQQYFSTLVTDAGSASTTGYSPGGVAIQNRTSIDQQGLIQASSSNTDVAISGDGFFVVADGTGGIASGAEISFTRAGAFRTDELGNLRNAAGQFLQAWPLDSEGRLPGEAGNILNTTVSSLIESLETVSIGTASGDANATSAVSVGINLDASEVVFPGSGDIARPTSVENLGITSSQIIVPNANLTVGDALSISINATTPTDFIYGGFELTGDITGGILGATSATDPFSAGVADGDAFTITTTSDPSNPITLTFTTSTSPNTANGFFNNLATLADAINKQTGFTSRVQTVGAAVNLYVSADDARDGLTFAQVGGSTANFPVALGLTTFASVTTNRWNTLNGLGALVDEQASTRAEVLNGETTTASVNLFNSDPLANIQFANVNNGGASDFLTEFGLSGALIDPSYSSSATSTTSMSSGAITPHFIKGLRIYDSLGDGHDIRLGFLKLGTNVWSVEVYVTDATETSTTGSQITAGVVQFNGDGTLAAIDSTLTQDVGVTWNNGSLPSVIDFDYGTPGAVGTGQSDGLQQSSGPFSVDFLTQNGAPVGLLASVTIDEAGFITANFNNGQSRRLYKIPLADFTNPNGLLSKAGNLYGQSFNSGEANLKEIGDGGIGVLVPSALESSNADIAEELTDMIVAQRAYQASAKVITTADELLDELNRVT